jgi:hypothetical protein
MLKPLKYFQSEEHLEELYAQSEEQAIMSAGYPTMAQNSIAAVKGSSEPPIYAHIYTWSLSSSWDSKLKWYDNGR